MTWVIMAHRDTADLVTRPRIMKDRTGEALMFSTKSLAESACSDLRRHYGIEDTLFTVPSTKLQEAFEGGRMFADV